MMLKNKQNEKGFTLIELLVVVAIIGLLASVILASLSTAREKARDATRISDINQVQTGLELFYGSCSQYPATLTTAESSGCGGTTTLGDFLSAEIFSDPDGVAYEYFVTTDGNGYCLGAELEDESHANANATSTTAGPCETKYTTITGFDQNTDFVALP